MFCDIRSFPCKQDWAMNISGRRGQIRQKRAYSSGCQRADRLPSPTGILENRTTSGTRTGRRSIVWSCGTGMERDSSGTTRRVPLRHSSCVKCLDSSASA